MIKAINKFLEKHKNGFYSGVIASFIAVGLTASATLSLILTIFTLTVSLSIFIDYMYSKKKVFTTHALIVMGIIGTLLFLKDSSIITLSAFNIPLQASIPIKAIGSFSNLGFLGSFGGIAMLLFRIPTVGPILAAVLILGTLALLGVPFFGLVATVIFKFDQILLILGIISFVFLLLKLRR
ncbi:MAG: hypothetical protein U9O94_08430 [Nanoarchaeota archaeon]|nr:hypothetical protein [Nanoarchaeota archaeon]